MTERTDEEIAAVVQAGNIYDFGELVLRYEPKMMRYARKFLSCQEDIEDLVQDVFIKAYSNLQSFDTSLRFSPWLYRIAHNTFVNELKRKSRFSLGVFEADVLLPQLPAKESSDDQVLETELKGEMELHLAKLAPKYREVIILHYFDEFSYQEISDIMQIPITTVGVRILRAKNKLKQTLKKLYE
ncbi:RNA polymerase sigma factor [Candidatus Nomurabacteria bacterium]|nr:RNA polymerase sigma factor [Candidatus Kaiserbacteria bacterium]MCB9811076.1 RNA polymerase sigma factor [Candidatus Nomurabacteria bacterium]MCB9814936.1 RNA polymerase sigma factor [Candidatus Nomurabacteria bacterium]